MKIIPNHNRLIYEPGLKETAQESTGPGDSGGFSSRQESLYQEGGRRQSPAQKGTLASTLPAEREYSEAALEEVQFESILQAIDEFQSHALTQEKGLSAHLNEQRPGLTVVLKDREGSVIRQLSGDEFLNLREVGPVNSQSRGKILDRKF